MRPPIRVSRLPAQYRQPVRAMCRKILRRYPNAAAFAVIGSVADGSWEPDSDVDMAWVTRGRLRKKWHDELDYHYEGVVELVTLNVSSLRRNFAQNSSLAHAIQRGIVLYDPDGLLKRHLRLKLGLPTPDWMQEWWRFFWHRFNWGVDSYRTAKRMHRRFCREKCSCDVTEILTRAVMNLARLLIITAGVVPNSKEETRRRYPSVIRGPRLRQAMEIALKAHHEKRDLTLDEATELVYLGRWLRARLVRILGKPEAPSKK